MLDLGIYAWFGYPLSLDERLTLIANAGFRITCLWLGEEEDLIANGDGDMMPSLAREAGLAIDNIHAPFEHCNHLWSESKASSDIVRNEYRSALSFCDKHNIRNLVIHVARGLNPPPQSERGLKILRELVSYAQDHDLVLAVENTRCHDYADFIFSNLESPHLGLCYDSSHDFLKGQTRGRFLKKWGHRLVTTHLSDNHGENDDHFLPGNGQVDWPLLVESFPTETYEGRLLLEVVPDDSSNMTAEEFLRIAYEKGVELKDQLG